MKFYKNAIILVLIVALLAGVYVFVLKTRPESEDNTSDLLKLTDYISSDVESVTLENPDGTFVIVRKDDEWVLSSPSDLKYDSSVLSSIVINAASITADRLVEENAQDIAKYGLDDPVIVRMKTKDGKETVLEVGDRTPTKSGYYIKFAGENDVYIIGTYTGNYLVTDRNGMRSKQLFDFELDDINTLAMNRKGQKVFRSVKEEKDDISSWKLTEPIKGSVNGNAIYPMLEALANTTVDEFLEDKPSDLAQYGLDEPVYEFEIGTEAAGTYKLLMGDEKEKGSTIYAKLGNSDEVFAVDISSYNAFLDKPLKEIVSVFVYLVNIDDVKKIDLTMDGKTTNMVLDIYKDSEGNSDRDKDKFYVNGMDASGKNEDGDQPFRKFYQALIGISLDEVDVDGRPEGDAEITINYTLKDGSMKVEFISKDDNYYYVVRNSEYAGILVKKNKKSFGVMEMKEAYKTLMDFLSSQQK
ncbi:MAG: DUF4340 domain-containing protein [Acetivibrionales bacterium]|jgi:hypothetical protein